MSHLLQVIAREESLAAMFEAQLSKNLRQETQNLSSKHGDEDWDYLWTDVGGEG